MPLYVNELPHPVYVGGKLIQAGSSRDVPEGAMPHSAQPAEVEPSSGSSDAGGDRPPAGESAPAVADAPKPNPKRA